jgi:hypothetical protein
MAEIRRNEAQNGIEVVFPAKPADEIRLWLISKGFRYHKYKKHWYNKFTQALLDEVTDYLGQPEAQITERELAIGVEIEMEHTSDPEVAEKIAMDHLKENPKYYSEPKPANWGIQELEKESAVVIDDNPLLQPVIERDYTKGLDPEKLKTEEIPGDETKPFTFDEDPQHQALIDEYAAYVARNEIATIDEWFKWDTIGKESNYPSVIRGIVTQEAIDAAKVAVNEKSKVIARNYYDLIIKKEDYKRLHGYITNTANKASRKMFQAVTGINVGKTVSEAEKAVDDYFGADVVNAEKTMAAEEKRKRDEAYEQQSWDKDLMRKVKIGMDIITWKEHIDNEIAAGYNKAVIKKKGVAPVIELTNKDGQFWTFRKKGHMEYIKWVLAQKNMEVSEPHGQTQQFTAKEIFEKIKPIKTGKTLNELAAEKKLKDYIPTSADFETIIKHIEEDKLNTLYGACLMLYNYRVGNKGDIPLEGSNDFGEWFILNMMKRFIEKEWDGNVIADKQKFDFSWPGFGIPAPELILQTKLPPKTKKPIPDTIEELVKCLKDLVAKDDNRPAMKYVFRDDSGITASNSYILVHLPTSLGKEFTLYDPKTGEELSSSDTNLIGTYPNYKMVIPKEFKFSTNKLDLETLMNIFASYANVRKIIKPDSDYAFSAFVRVKFGDNIRWYDSFKLFQVADALYCQGTRSVTLNYPENKVHPLVFKDIDNENQVGLVMPIEMHDDDQTKNSFYIDLSNEMVISEEKVIKNQVKTIKADIAAQEVVQEIKEEPEYFTKDNAPDNIKDRFGIAKEGFLDKRAGIPKTLIETLDNGLRLYSIDGKYARDFLYSDFSQGGNDLAYPEFVPIGEAWYEEGMEEEKEHIIKHEKDERELMLGGMIYDDAHEKVKKEEDSERGKTDSMEIIYPFNEGDLVVFKPEFRESNDKFIYKLTDPDKGKGSISPINSKLPFPSVEVVELRMLEKVPKKPKPDILNTFLPKLKIVMPFISQAQIDYLTRLYRSEERQGAQDIVDRLAGVIETMPKTYETEDIKTDDKIVYLHYYQNNSDFYIIEKDKGQSRKEEKEAGLEYGKQYQAYGYAILNGDHEMAEWGYINIEELRENNVELDFNWDPKKFSEVKKKWEPEEERTPADVIRLQVIEYNGVKYFVDWKLQEVRNVKTAESTKFTDIHEKEFKAALRFLRVEQGPNVYFAGLDDPDIVPETKEFVPESIISSPETSISVSISDYPNEFELNKAIESLLDKKWNDIFSEDELTFIKAYTGYGGLDEFVMKGGGKIDVKALFEYFTPDKVIEKMWGLAYRYGYKDGPICEPSLGIGAFFDRRFVANTIEKHGYEINKYSAKIAKLLYPEAVINDGADIKHFEQLFLIKNYTVRAKVTPKYSLVIGNPPYGKIGGTYMGMGEASYTHASNYIEYFILRGLDLLIKDGLLIYIIGAETAAGGKPFLDQGMTKTKEMIAERGKLIDAYRLPSGVFSRTDVTSDIVCFKKR